MPLEFGIAFDDFGTEPRRVAAVSLSRDTPQPSFVSAQLTVSWVINCTVPPSSTR